MTIRESLRDHPIRAFALLCVAATSLFLGVMAWRLNETLSSPDWCARALQADKITPDSKFDGLLGCVGLLTIQLKSLATNSHIIFGVFALTLAVLIVIVIAGARFAGKVSREGAEIDLSREEAAEEVAVAAVDKAAEITGG